MSKGYSVDKLVLKTSPHASLSARASLGLLGEGADFAAKRKLEVGGGKEFRWWCIRSGHRNREPSVEGADTLREGNWYLCRPSFRPYLQVLFFAVAEQIPVTSKDMESGIKT